MFERFESRARHAVVLAQEEARRLDHDYIGTEHQLLALLRVGDPAVQAAIGSRLTLARARQAVEEIIGRGGSAPTGHVPFTPRAKKVLELSLREALRLRHRGIDAGHIFLGLLREGEGVGAQILAGAGIDFDDARAAAVEALGVGTVPPEPSRGRGFLRTWRRGPAGPLEETVSMDPDSPFDPGLSLVQMRPLFDDDAVAAIDAAIAEGEDDIPRPWPLLVAIAGGSSPAAEILAGVDLAAAPAPEDDPIRSIRVFVRASSLAQALGSISPAPGSAEVGPQSRITVAHLLAVLLSPGGGSVADHLDGLGVNTVELRRQVLGLL